MLIWSVHLVEQVYPSLSWVLGVEVCKLYCCLCVIALIVGMEVTAFSANSNVNTRACIQLRVADDDIYGTSPVPVYTVVLSISSPTSRVTVGDISQTTITVNDDDGTSVMCVNDLLVYPLRADVTIEMKNDIPFRLQFCLLQQT